MKIRVHVTGLEDVGDAVKVEAQGRSKRDAAWRSMQSWNFKVPDHVARRWTIGTELEITVKAK